MTDKPGNLSTENQPKGSAINLRDTLDRGADSGDYQQIDLPEKTDEDYRAEHGDKPDSATVSHAPPSPNANPNA